ncbi:unnamed protein product [Phytophthora fragariaefolia]|uniref:Unnamed protein product n=1 Tax=Phytophthora fragariaefolia TaxID=1490495 RepID=A0A9W7CZT9_9STRA|nr:unnamed protein product [Phytophthora fragariaefolia]
MVHSGHHGVHGTETAYWRSTAASYYVDPRDGGGGAQQFHHCAKVGQMMWIERPKIAIGTDGAFLIEEVGEKMDPIFAPVIQLSSSRRGGCYEIHASVPYNDNFHLYLHTSDGQKYIAVHCKKVKSTQYLLQLLFGPAVSTAIPGLLAIVLQYYPSKLASLLPLPSFIASDTMPALQRNWL